MPFPQTVSFPSPLARITSPQDASSDLDLRTPLQGEHVRATYSHQSRSEREIYTRTHLYYGSGRRASECSRCALEQTAERQHR